jgi:S-adenosylmethionine-diacylgycerolhomoserine-N-methlytransferase
MSGYYAWQSRIYDATRWAFLFGRKTILDELHLKPGDTVVEVGCGTGHNLESIVRRVGERGEVFAVDCAEPMLARCAERIRRKGWNNVRLVDREYGTVPVTGGKADAVLMSYSVSMIPDWESVIRCAFQELKAGGRIGVVDFCQKDQAAVSKVFKWWMTRNHVFLDRPYIERLSSSSHPTHRSTRRAFGGLWSYYLFAGKKE